VAGGLEGGLSSGVAESQSNSDIIIEEALGDRYKRRSRLAGAANSGPSDAFGALALDQKKRRPISPGRGKKFSTFSVRGERLSGVDLSLMATYLPQHAKSIRKFVASWCPRFDSIRLRALEESITIAAKHNLEELDLSYCKLRNEGAAMLMRMIGGSKSLRILRISGCLLGASEAPVIAGIIMSCPNLEELHASQNDFRPTGARSIE